MPSALPTFCQTLAAGKVFSRGRAPWRAKIWGGLLSALLLWATLISYAERLEEPQLDETSPQGMQVPMPDGARNLIPQGKPSGMTHITQSAIPIQGELLAPFEAGVKAYREGNYRQAGKLFDTLHRQAPENTKITYYLAITAAQLGRFQQAKSFYEEIITLDPNGEAANLAQEGLKYLPPKTSLDLPPRFQQASPSPGGEKVTTTATGPAGGTNPTPAMPPAMSAQDLMAWQMLMGQNNSNNGMGSGNMMGGFMPNMMMGQGNNSNGSSAGGMSGFDPAMMSTMMMNQMMQNLTPGSDQNENH